MDSTKAEETFVLFKDDGIHISTDMRRVLSFLAEIEAEIATIFSFKDKLRDLYDHYRELLGCTAEMARLMKEKNIKFEYQLKSKPETILEKVKTNIPIRSQMIVLFASIEVIFFLHLAYENKTTDDNELRNLARDDKKLKKFINIYLLSKNNSYYKENFGRLSKISSKNFRLLRNSLTHFFSIFSEIIIVQDNNSEKINKTKDLLYTNGLKNLAIVSPNDLLELIKSAHHLLFKKWSDDYESSPINFQEKIKVVIELVKTRGAYIVNESDINL